jgi:uncharacterized paraquat-inducible protein A
MSQDPARTDDQVRCPQCGASFLVYERFEFDECPSCGKSLKGARAPSRARAGRRKVALVLFVLGLALLAVVAVIALTRGAP